MKAKSQSLIELDHKLTPAPLHFTFSSSQNRAAAYSSVGDHQKAVEDAEQALEVDGSFVKAYSRLG